MILQLDAASPVPQYEQLRAQVTAMIASGQLSEGTPLPTIRRLAADLGIAPGTVARAYRELEATGAVVSRGRRGTFVGVFSTEPRRVVDQHDLERVARAFAVSVAQLGVGEQTALEAARRAITELAPKSTADAPAVAPRRTRRVSPSSPSARR